MGTDTGLYATVIVAALTGSTWTTLAPGFEHRSATLHGTELEILRADPTRVGARVVVAEKGGLTARQMAAAPDALAAVNGGFFSPGLEVVGLRRSGGRRIAGTLRRGLGALAWSEGKTPRVVMGGDVAALEGMTEVLQCGPRLVVSGRPNQLKPQVSRRTVAGIDGVGRLLLIVTRHGLLEANDLASWLARPETAGGLGLIEALNLDGGGSSQMFANGPQPIDVPGADVVADGIVLYPR